MLDKSMDGARLALRKGIIRGDGAGLEHVEALLALRRVTLPRVLPAKRADAGLILPPFERARRRLRFGLG